MTKYLCIKPQIDSHTGFNIKTSSYQYKNAHYKDKTALRQSYNTVFISKRGPRCFTKYAHGLVGLRFVGLCLLSCTGNRAVVPMYPWRNTEWYGHNRPVSNHNKKASADYMRIPCDELYMSTRDMTSSNRSIFRVTGHLCGVIWDAIAPIMTSS